MTKFVHALLRHPLLHFAALGMALYAAQASFEANGLIAQPKPVVQLDAETVAELRRQADAHDVPLQRLLRARIDEAVLLDQAIRRDLDRRDPVARRRLLQNMRLSYPDAGEAELLRRARALDMPRRDVLVRRRLIERMQVELAGDSPARTVAGKGPLSARREAARFDLAHVFVAGRDDAARQRAESLRAALSRGEVTVDAAGDPHLGGRQLRDVAAADIRRRIASPVAQAALRGDAGKWLGPVASAQGWHLLRVAPGDTAVVSDPGWEARAAHYLARAQSRRGAVAHALADLRARYAIELPEMVAEAAP